MQSISRIIEIYCSGNRQTLIKKLLSDIYRKKTVMTAFDCKVNLRVTLKFPGKYLQQDLII